MEYPFPDEPHQVAKEGTAAHWVGETCLTNPAFTPQAMLGQVHGNGVAVDQEMADHVDIYLAEVRSVVGQDKLYIEQPLDLGWLYPGTESTPDAWYYCTQTQVLYLWDFKYGWRAVEADGNWQLTEYLAGILGFLGPVPIARIEAVIIQPRPSHSEGRIRRWHTSTAELGPLIERLQKSAQEATGANPMCKTGSWCRDCRALAACPYSDQAALAAIEVSGRVAHVKPSAEQMASEITILQAAKEALDLRLATIETVAVSAMEKGGIVPGYAMERSFGKKRWVDNNALKAVEVMTGVSLFEEKPVTPAEAKRRKMDPATLALYTTAPETGNKLVKRNLGKKASKVFGVTTGATQP